jgi:hypothetical protein
MAARNYRLQAPEYWGFLIAPDRIKGMLTKGKREVNGVCIAILLVLMLEAGWIILGIIYLVQLIWVIK